MGSLSGMAPHTGLIEFLLAQGAPADLPDIGGLTALHHVAMNNVVGSVIKACSPVAPTRTREIGTVKHLSRVLW
jgi:hypothetical protein